jgi:flagellar assembly protein FliH
VTTSSSDFIPKEQLSAYQRWELASLQDDNAVDSTADSEEHSAAVQAQVQVELEALRTQAHDEAYAAGYAAGLAGAAEAQQKLEALLTHVADRADEHRQQLLDEVLDLALLVGRQLVGEALAVRRELVLPIVSAALKQLPQASQRVQLLLNPADVELVSTFIASEQLPAAVRLVADVTIAPGGCRLETEQMEVDATVPSRWRRLLANLGRSDDWLEPA